MFLLSCVSPDIWVKYESEIYTVINFMLFTQVTRLEQLPCDPSKIPVLLLGNKYDIVEERLRAERLKRALKVSRV